MKRYTYDFSHYMIQMTIPGIFILFVGIYSFYKFLVGGFNFLWILVTIVCIYNTWNTFVSISNPSEITIDDEHLVLSAFARSHEYMLDKIKKFAMRPVAGGDRLYITIDNGGVFRGRYWIRLSEFNDVKELTNFFYRLDARVNPDSIFTTARRQGRERQNRKKNNKV